MLATVSLTQLDPSDLCVHLPFIVWLRRPGEESALWEVIGSLATLFKPHKYLNYLASYDYNAE
jgi:hypothetical protein